MNKKEDNLKALLNEYKEEQIRINKRIDEQDKKNKRVIIILILVSLILNGITHVASYTLGANSVEYTAKDANWHVENTQEAIDDLYNSLGSSLVGSVYSYMGVNVPFGYLACDGSTYNIEDYPRLANHINSNFGKYNYFGGNGTTTFAVPDLRGEFLRGTGTNTHSNQGNGASVGAHQNATQVLKYWTGDGGHYNVSPIENGDSSIPPSTTVWKYYSSNQNTNNNERNVYPYWTVRPTNTSVLYIIKY